MPLEIKKTQLEEGDELPTHRENVLCSTPVNDGIGETVLEVWYVERTGDKY